MKATTLLVLAASTLITGVYGETASQFISQGDGFLSSGEFQAAIRAYDSAVRLEPDNYLYLFKRSAAYLSIGKNVPALDDLESILKLKPGFEGALVQRSRINLKMGKFDVASADAQAVHGQKGVDILEQISESQEAWQRVEQALENQDWEACVEHSSVVISHAPNNLEMRRNRANCRLHQGHSQEALVDLSNIASMTLSDPEPFAKMAYIYYYSLNDYNKAMQSVQRCLRFDPDAKPCKAAHRQIKKMSKKLTGFGADDRRKKASGHKVWSDIEKTLLTDGLYNQVVKEAQSVLVEKVGIQHAPMELEESLDAALCDALFLLKKYDQGEVYCDKVLEKDPQYSNAYLLKAQSALDKEEYDQAVNILSDAIDNHKVEDPKVHNKRAEAQADAKRAKTKDYYKILGVNKQATEKDLKKAYRTKSKEFHPDRYKGELSEEQVQRKMADINEAYEILTDADKRQRYDMGESFEHGGEQQYHPRGHGHHGFNGFPGGGNMHFKFNQQFGGQGFGFDMFADQFMRQQQQQQQQKQQQRKQRGF